MMRLAPNLHPAVLAIEFLRETGALPLPMLSLDIETTANPEAVARLGPAPDNKPDALHPARLRIACIQLMDVAGGCVVIEGAEKDILTEFFEIFPAQPGAPALVTWNGTRFDLPAIELRALANSVPVPPRFRSEGRWANREIAHFDLGQRLACGGQVFKLHEAAVVFGLPGKSDPNLGKSVAELLKDESRRAEALEYCIADVLTPIHVAYRCGFFHWAATEFAASQHPHPFLIDPECRGYIAPPTTESSPAWIAELATSLETAVRLRGQLEAGSKTALKKLPDVPAEIFERAAQSNGLHSVFTQEFVDLCQIAAS